MAANRPREVRRPARFAVVLTLLAALKTATPAWAWGRLGHRVIARLAEQHMTPEAKAAVAVLLEPGESMADASLWANENRGRLPKSAPWHYVDVPLDEHKYHANFSGDVSSMGCVVDTEARTDNAELTTPTKLGGLSTLGGSIEEERRDP